MFTLVIYSGDMYYAFHEAEKSEQDGAFIFTIGINLDDTTEINQLSSHPLSYYQTLINHDDNPEDVLRTAAEQFSLRVHQCKFHNKSTGFASKHYYAVGYWSIASFFYYLSLTKMSGVVRGLIDIIVVLTMSTSWTPMLARAGSILSCLSMRLTCQVPDIDGGL